MEETMFYRGKDVESDLASGTQTPTKGEDPNPLASDEEKKVDMKTTTAESYGSRQTPVYKTKTYLDKLKLITVIKEKPNELLKMWYRPLLLLQFPVVSYSGLQYGINLCWFNVLNATAALILSGPPYNFKASFIGVAYIAPMVGVTFAYVTLEDQADSE
jgi:hypothetical protein